jgi:3'-5' exoribonuclease
LKAHTITGARSSGRSRQITSVIDLTVPDVRSGDHDWNVTIAELRPGGEVEGVFACTRKDRLTARNGSPYLAVELRDRTGAIPGRAFRDADFLAAQFERGDLVAVSGRVERFRDELQVDLRTIRRAAEEVPDPSEFLPVAYRDMEELEGFLEHLAREVDDPDLRALLDSFLGDEAFRAEFRRAPCTRSGHHAYLGGLIEHTVAVATLAYETCMLHPRLDSDLLITAAILHDIGKTLEFQLGAEIALSEAGALVGHVALGQQLVTERARGLDGFPEAKLHALSHCILGHHGPDPLPGRRFRSAEGLALYRLNALDAGVKGALEHGLE